MVCEFLLYNKVNQLLIYIFKCKSYPLLLCGEKIEGARVKGRKPVRRSLWVCRTKALEA